MKGENKINLNKRK